jgi:hypothetical protein
MARKMIEDENGVYIRGWRLEIEESVRFLEAVSPCMPANVQVIAGIFRIFFSPAYL